MAALAPTPKFQAITTAGVPYVGAKLYTYAAGTTTPQTSYTSSAQTTANANPVILDSRGEADVMLVAGSRMGNLDVPYDRYWGDPADKNLYDLPPEEDAKIPTVCSSLDQALEYLDKDREFLTRGGVFSNEMIDAYIELKMQDVTRFRMTTHPVEFDMYYSS